MSKNKAPKSMVSTDYETYLEECYRSFNASERGQAQEFDLSDVDYFDIASLLHLICVLQYVKAAGRELRLVLPEGNDKSKVKSRDFLKRWKFFRALRENVGDPFLLIPESQHRYFDEKRSDFEKQTYYLPLQIQEEKDIIHEVLSKDIVEIIGFTKQEKNVQRVNEGLITNYVNTFETDKDVAGSLASLIGLTIDASAANNETERQSYEVFYKNLIHESLLNTLEHSVATISLAGISSTPSHSHIVIGIVDNGITIPGSIESTYKRRSKRRPSPNDNLDLFGDHMEIPKLRQGEVTETKVIDDAVLTHFACQEGVTSKGARSGKNGLGLTYLVINTLALRGQVSIRSRNAIIRFKSQGGLCSCEAFPATNWRGTLLRIMLPIMKRGAAR